MSKLVHKNNVIFQPKIFSRNRGRSLEGPCTGCERCAEEPRVWYRLPRPLVAAAVCTQGG